MAAWSPAPPTGTVRSTSIRVPFGHPERPVAGAIVLIAVVGVCAPIFGWFPVIRVPALLVPLLVWACVSLRSPARREAVLEACARWRPSPQTLGRSAVVAAGILGWIVLTRFLSGEINGVDFTVYFDRPCFQTAQGRWLFIETADDPRFSFQGQLVQHAYWGLPLLCAPYWILPSPYWLLALAVIAPVAGAVYLFRIASHIGATGVLAAATAIAFLANDNLARGLNYGFHPELLYAWFIPWMFEAGLRGRWKSYLVASVACILVKEDAVFALVAVAAALTLVPRSSEARRPWLIVAPVLAGVANLVVYWFVFLPMFSAGPVHLEYWSAYGSSPASVLNGLWREAGAVFSAAVTSPFWTTVLLPHLLLPLVGWRWTLGLVPVVLLYSASTSPAIRTFSVYYAVILLPFLAIGACAGAMRLARAWGTDRRRAEAVAAGLLVLGAVVVGSGNRGYTLRPWRAEVQAMPGIVQELASERRVLVQSGLYPHVGYDARFHLLTPATLADPASAGAAVLLAPALGAFPFTVPELLAHPDLQDRGKLHGGVLLGRVP